MPTPLATRPAATAAPVATRTLQTGGEERVEYQAGQSYLVIELLRDDLVHFQYSTGTPPDLNQPIYTTPMVANTSYPGASGFRDDGRGTLETADLTLGVDPSTLSLTVIDKSSGQAHALTTLSPRNVRAPGQGLTLTPEDSQNVYGLGEQFMTPGSSQGDWMGKVRTPGNEYGNAQVAFNAATPAMPSSPSCTPSAPATRAMASSWTSRANRPGISEATPGRCRR